MKKCAVLAVLMAFVLMPPPRLSSQAASGLELVEKLYSAFAALSENRAGTDETINSLESLMTAAVSARDAKAIDPSFFRRYHRLLMVVRLSLVTDMSGILKPLVDREFGGFIKDVTGEAYDAEGSATRQIAQFLKAVDAEIMNLYGIVRKK
ncbi:MAG: hypothetical protein FJY80_08660 [Candidatus Aminicenantes bacterium]|nr:hypothetical protein [Candidatus Aminicenantes bacterium]MBM3311564.1 hypothetical protein [Candidatus Aminicenantes bacterium]